MSGKEDLKRREEEIRRKRQEERDFVLNVVRESVEDYRKFLNAAAAAKAENKPLTEKFMPSLAARQAYSRASTEDYKRMEKEFGADTWSGWQGKF